MMLTYRGRILLILALMFVSCRAAAQTTRPSAGERWNQTIETLAKALSESDASRMLELIDERCAMSTFEGRTADAIRLLAHTAKGSVVISRGYPAAPGELAADVSRGFESLSPALPDQTRRFMLVRNDVHARQANATARKWMIDILGAKESEPVGIIALWCDRTRTAEAAGGAEVIFVLVRGEIVADNWRIASISFGGVPQAHP